MPKCLELFTENIHYHGDDFIWRVGMLIYSRCSCVQSELYFATKTVHLDCQKDLGVFDLFLPDLCYEVGIPSCPSVGSTNPH